MYKPLTTHMSTL